MNKKTLDSLTASMNNVINMFNKMNTAMQDPKPPPFDPKQLVPKITLPDNVMASMDKVAKVISAFGAPLGVPKDFSGQDLASFITGTMTTIAAYNISTQILGDVMKDLKTSIVESVSKLGDLQAKALATNINLKDLYTGGGLTQEDATSLRSSLVDVNTELLNFREAGITKLDKNILNLVDKMVFTGQKTGALATFLTNTALAVNLNSEQASLLAGELAKSSELYGTQLDSLFQIAKTMEEVNTNLVALVGADIGPELIKAQSSYIDKFGAKYAGDIKNIFGLVFDPKNQTSIIAGGFTAQAERLMRGQMTAEQFKEFSKQLATYFDRVLGKTTSYGQLPAQQSLLESMGGDVKSLISLRNIGTAQVKEAMQKSAYDTTIVIKDFTTAIKNNFTKFAENIGEVFKAGFAGAGGDYKTIRNVLNPVFKQINNSFLDMTVGILKYIQEFTNNFDKHKIDVKDVNQRLQKSIDEVERLKKTSKLDQVRQNQLRSLRPDDFGAATDIGNAQLAALERIEKNTYDQKRMTDMAVRLSTAAMHLANNQVG